REDTDGSDAGAETAPVRRRLPPARPGPETPPPEPTRTRWSGPARTLGGGYWLQRGRLEPRYRRFGEVTSRIRQTEGYNPRNRWRRPFFRPFPAPCHSA